MQKWEYIVLISEVTGAFKKVWAWEDKNTKSQSERLTELGQEGWELISVTPYSSGGYGNTEALYFYLKRLIE